MSYLPPPNWINFLDDRIPSDYWNKLNEFLNTELSSNPILPHPELIYRACELTPPESVSVVILGQDPYHTPGCATGLAFAVPSGTNLPPSLRNIFRELVDDAGSITTTSDLESWARQGVLLLNTTLTVRPHQPLSHRKGPWDSFTTAIIQQLSQQRDHCVFILWGSHAQQYLSHIDIKKHFVIQSPHPSPLSAHKGFFGSRPFSKTNHQLVAWNKSPIVW
jgi:uracil-DNA glycosylase